MIKIAIKLFIFMALTTGLLYPLLITIIAQLAMPHLANGSLITQKGKVIGSELIAQSMLDERYFWPRPSAIHYDPLHPSGGSNLGPISKKLMRLVEERKQIYGQNAPSEMLYASGSGLDPHISIETAYYQASRVAKARGISEADLKDLIVSLLAGQPYVNVLLLNLQLDR